MSKGIYFKNVLKTLVTHTGTKVEYAMPTKKASIEVLTNNGIHKDGFNTAYGAICDNAKIITFAENSPMKKLGIDQALLGYNEIAGVNTLSFWQDGQIVKSQVMKNKEDVNYIKNYLIVLADLIKHQFKLPS